MSATSSPTPTHSHVIRLRPLPPRSPPSRSRPRPRPRPRPRLPPPPSPSFTLLLLVSLLLSLPLPACTAYPSSQFFTTPLGTKLPLSHLSSFSINSLDDSVFHLHPLTGDLISHHRTIRLSSVAPHIRYLPPHHPSPLHIINNSTDSTDHDDHDTPFMRVGPTHTFVYSSRTNQLITAWAPSFHLQLVHPSFPNIFINTHTTQPDNLDLQNDILHPLGSANRKYLTSTITSTTAPGGPNANSGTYFELAVAHDMVFCTRHHQDPVKARLEIQALVSEIHVFFYDVVDVQLVAVFSHCQSLSSDPFSKAVTLAPCQNKTKTKCQTAQHILESVSRFFMSDTSAISYDAAYLFTGYDDDTPIAGAAYLKAACVHKFRYGWVEFGQLATHASVTTILVHELGHTLGAKHSPTGFMQPRLATVNQEDSWFFAAESIAQMRAYIQSISSMKCLVPHVGRAPNGTLTTHFTTARGKVWQATDMAFGHALTAAEASTYKQLNRTPVTSATYGGEININSTHVYFLYAHQTSIAPLASNTVGDIRFMYAHGVVLPDSQERKPFVTDYKRLLWIPVHVQNNKQRMFRHIGGALAVVHKKRDNATTNESTSHLVVLYVEARRNASSTDVLKPPSVPGAAWLSIGHALNATGIVMGGWTRARLPTRVNLASALCIGLASASLRVPHSTDLLLVHVRPFGASGNNNKRTHVGLYNVLYDFDPDTGTVSSVSDTHFIPGSFANVGDISLALSDVDNNGALDIVVLHTTKLKNTWSSVMTVGLGIDRNGRVPRANWRRYAPDLRAQFQQQSAPVTGGIAVQKMRAWPGKPVTAVFTARTNSNGWIFNHVEMADGLLDPEEGSKNKDGRKIVQGETLTRCKECYDGEERVNKCLSQLDVCLARGTQYQVEIATRASRTNSRRSSSSSASSRRRKSEMIDEWQVGRESDVSYEMSTEPIPDDDKEEEEEGDGDQGNESEIVSPSPSASTSTSTSSTPSPTPSSFSTSQSSATLGAPDRPSLECEGFRQVYLKQDGNGPGCTREIAAEEEVAAGAGHTLFEDLNKEIQSDYGMDADAVQREWSPKIEAINVTYSVGGAGSLSTPFRLPITVQVYFQNSRNIRKRVVKAIVKKLRTRPDFSTIFQRKMHVKYRVKRKIGKTRIYFVVITLKLQLAFVQRVYGARANIPI